MNDKMDYGEWLGNQNEAELLEDFVGQNDDNNEMICGALELAILNPGLYKTAVEAMGAWVLRDKLMREEYEEWLEAEWESYRDSGPEPDREGD